MSDTVIRVENVSKLYRLGEVGTGSLAHDVNRWWHKVRGKEDPYLKIGEVNDRTKSVSGSKKRNLTTIEHGGRCEKEQPKVGPKGERVGTSESKDTESTEGNTGVNQRPDSAEFLEGHSQAGLQMDSEKLASIRFANDSRASGEQTGSDSESVIIRDIRGKKSSAATAPKAQAPSDWVYALKDVSFEVKRGELRTLGRSEKEISKKCLGATKVPDSGRRRHQLLGIIGRNGAGKSTLLKILSRVTTQSSGQIKVTQAAWEAARETAKAARRVRRTGVSESTGGLLRCSRWARVSIRN